MNKMPQPIESSVGSGRRRTIDIVNRGLKRRYRAERGFKIYGITAIVLSLVFLALLFITLWATVTLPFSRRKSSSTSISTRWNLKTHWPLTPTIRPSSRTHCAPCFLTSPGDGTNGPFTGW
jgi:ABC-type phosphate transport system permease subunit